MVNRGILTNFYHLLRMRSRRGEKWLLYGGLIGLLVVNGYVWRQIIHMHNTYMAWRQVTAQSTRYPKISQGVWPPSEMTAENLSRQIEHTAKELDVSLLRVNAPEEAGSFYEAEIQTDFSRLLVYINTLTGKLPESTVQITQIERRNNEVAAIVRIG